MGWLDDIDKAQNGKTEKRFMQPTDDYLPNVYNEDTKESNSEVSMSIGGENGEPAYMIPSFKYGRWLDDPIAEFNKTGEHLGGPFKTWQEAEKFGKLRHKYVEQGKDIPIPIPTRNMQDGGVIEDDRGQWEHPGKITKINSNNITMKGVNYPVLGISNTGDKQMMYPGEDYKFDGNSVVEYPIKAQKGRTESPKEWLNTYISSPKYKERLESSGYTNVDDEISIRKKNVKRTKLGNTKGESHYDTNEKLIKINPTEQEYLQDQGSDILSHEFGHAEIDGRNMTGRLNKEDYSQLYGRANRTGAKGHDLDPRENKSDINALRFELSKQGIYDAGKEDFIKEHLNEAKNSYIRERLLKNFNEDDLIYIMNNVADNTKASTKKIAQGGHIEHLKEIEIKGKRKNLTNSEKIQAYRDSLNLYDRENKSLNFRKKVWADPDDNYEYINYDNLMNKIASYKSQGGELKGGEGSIGMVNYGGITAGGRINGQTFDSTNPKDYEHFKRGEDSMWLSSNKQEQLDKAFKDDKIKPIGFINSKFSYKTANSKKIGDWENADIYSDYSPIYKKPTPPKITNVASNAQGRKNESSLEMDIRQPLGVIKPMPFNLSGYRGEGETWEDNATKRPGAEELQQEKNEARREEQREGLERRRKERKQKQKNNSWLDEL